MNCQNSMVLLLLLGLLHAQPCNAEYQTVLDDWIWSDPSLVNYETCRTAVNTMRWDAPQDDPDFYSAMGMNDVMVFRPRDPMGLARSSVIHKTKLWNQGVVPLSVPYGLSVVEKKILACAILFFHENTCIKFVPNHYTRPYRDFVSIRKSNGGCFSEDMGKKGGQHVVNLHYPYCWDQGTVIHELMHAIGFFHEQARNDRDKYISVHWDNIPDEGWKYQFLTGKETGVGQQLLGKYDYGSIMHYPRFSYAWGSQPTMSAKRGNRQENNKKMGNRSKPTTMDIQKINTLYQCRGNGKKKGSGSRQEQEPRVDEEEFGVTTRTNILASEEGPKTGSWTVPVIILAVLVVVNLILGLGIFAYRRRSQLLYRYRSFSKSSRPDIAPLPISKDIESPVQPKKPPPIKFRPSPANQQSASKPTRPDRPRDTVIRGLHEEVAEELSQNRFSWFFKKPKPVPQRKAPPPPGGKPSNKPKSGNSKLQQNSRNVSRVNEMKKKFENA